jgi:hypothetical protein
MSVKSFKTSGVGVDLAPKGLVLINTTSFSGVSSQAINTVFNSTYTNYRVFFNIKLSSDTDVYLRIRSGTTDLSSASAYLYGRYYVGETSSFASQIENNIGATQIPIAILGTWQGHSAMEFSSPFATEVTTFSLMASGRFTLMTMASLNNNTTSYDGFNFYPQTGTMTGSVSVYGYNK